VGLSYIFSPTLTASAQAGYYWLDSEIGQNNSGMTFKADITKRDERTIFVLSAQGGYTQDLFTSQNLGFVKYYRATGSITHFLDRRFSIGCLGSIERTERDPQPLDPADPGRRDLTWGAGANAAYQPLKWLRIALEYTYNQRTTNFRFEANEEYVENRAMLTLTATY
jgi:hypothetical protein